MKRYATLIMILCQLLCISAGTVSARLSGIPSNTSNNPSAASIEQLLGSLTMPATLLTRVVQKATPLAAQLCSNENKENYADRLTAARICLARSLKVSAMDAGNGFAWTSFASAASVPLYSTHAPPGTAGVVCLAVLLFIIILSRSNLPWAAERCRREGVARLWLHR